MDRAKLSRLLWDALFYRDREETVFRWSDQRITLDEDPYLYKMLPEIMEVLGPLVER